MLSQFINVKKVNLTSTLRPQPLSSDFKAALELERLYQSGLETGKPGKVEIRLVWLIAPCLPVSLPALLPCPALSCDLATVSSVPFTIFITLAFQDAVKNSLRAGRLHRSFSDISANGEVHMDTKKILEGKKLKPSISNSSGDYLFPLFLQPPRLFHFPRVFQLSKFPLEQIKPDKGAKASLHPRDFQADPLS